MRLVNLGIVPTPELLNALTITTCGIIGYENCNGLLFSRRRLEISVLNVFYSCLALGANSLLMTLLPKFCDTHTLCIAYSVGLTFIGYKQLERFYNYK